MRFRVTVPLLIAVASLSAAGADGQERMGPDLRATMATAEAGDRIDVIVHFADRADVQVHRALPRAARREAIIRTLRGRTEANVREAGRHLLPAGGDLSGMTVLWLAQAISLSGSPAEIERLASWSGVERIVLDRELTLDDLAAGPGPSADWINPEWNVDQVGAPAVWDLGYDGAGIVIGIVDSGVDHLHQDLGPRWRGGSNSWYDPNNEHPNTPHDASGHGTQVTGLALGGDAGGTTIGVAPGAQWIAAKAFDDSGMADYTTLHQSLQWMLDPDGASGTDDAADVVNNSWDLRDTIDVCELEFQQDIQNLRAAGVSVVFAAGNAGPNSSTSLSPANNPEAFAVGATNDFDVVYFSSSRGPSACGQDTYPEVVAPGAFVWTSDLTGGGAIPGSYTETDGTSFAAPHVSGGMAILRQAYPAATVSQIESAMLNSAVDLGTTGPDNDYGNGRIDLAAAYDELAGGGCTDADSDLYYAEAGCGSPQDCNDADGTVWALPGDARNLAFGPGNASLSWSVPLDPGASAGIVYDTLRSADPADFDTSSCVEWDDGTDTSASDPAVPGVGSSYFYLVRAENACGSGTLGSSSSGAGRTGGSCP